MLPFSETFENWTAAACSRMKSNTMMHAIRILLMFSYSMHMGIFPSWRNSSKSFLKYYQQYTGFPSACNCRHSKATHPQKTPRVKIDREILNNREIFRVNAATPRKNMSPVCSGGLLLEISEYKASILPYLGYENPFKMFHPSFPQWWG